MEVSYRVLRHERTHLVLAVEVPASHRATFAGGERYVQVPYGSDPLVAPSGWR